MADRDSPDIAQQPVISNPSIGHFWTHLELHLDMQRQRYEMSILCPGHFHKTCTQRAKAGGLFSFQGKAWAGQNGEQILTFSNTYEKNERQARLLYSVPFFVTYMTNRMDKVKKFPPRISASFPLFFGSIRRKFHLCYIEENCAIL